MADPSSSTLVGAILGASYAMSTALGVPVSVALMAVLGASIACSQHDRIGWSFASVLGVTATFLVSLSLGLFLGPPGGQLALSLLSAALDVVNVKAASFEGAERGAKAFAALAIAMFGQKELLARVPGFARRHLGEK